MRIGKIASNCEKNLEICSFFDLYNFKNCQFGKFDKFVILKISKISELENFLFGRFQKFSIL